MIPCEDGHAQERSLTPQILELVEARDVWIADRNFCTRNLLGGIADGKGFFVIRHHAKMILESEGTRRSHGRSETGEVYEEKVTIAAPDGRPMVLRRVVVRLDKPTRDGDPEISILTNLPESAADALTVAALFRKRWTLETMFQSLTAMLEGELTTLGYPRAALFGFSVALATYNTLSTVQAALRGEHGVEKVSNEVSAFFIANEVRAMWSGLALATEPDEWVPFHTTSAVDLAAKLRAWASLANLRKYKRNVRGEKKPVPKRERYVDETHVSTARLLSARRSAAKKKSP
jgi:hypothetical protein